MVSSRRGKSIVHKQSACIRSVFTMDHGLSTIDYGLTLKGPASIFQ